jgi:hypothetical protein
MGAGDDVQVRNRIDSAFWLSSHRNGLLLIFSRARSGIPAAQGSAGIATAGYLALGALSVKHAFLSTLRKNTVPALR